MHLKLQVTNESVKKYYEDMLKSSHHHVGDSGFDLCVAEETVVAPKETKLIPLGVKAAAYTNKETASQENSKSSSFFVIPRSSIYKTKLRQANSMGLIDAGYRGQLMMPVDNISDEPQTAKVGDRLCQAVAFDGSEISFELVEALPETERAEGGFGSTETNKQDENKKRPAEKEAEGQAEPKKVMQAVE